MFRIFDPYAIALCFLVGGVGFGMTFFFNDDFSEWGAEEILYPTMAMIYVYARNARFFESDEESAHKILEGHGDVPDSVTSKNSTAAAKAAASKHAGSVSSAAAAAGGNQVSAGEGSKGKLMAPSVANVPGLVGVTGPPLAAPGEGALAVVFFFATWCASCEKVMPTLLSVAARYSREGISFAGVTQEGEEDLRYFVETYKRPIRSVTLLADEQGVLTDGFQGAHNTKTIPHCYIVRGVSGGDGGFGVVEWHGHPARLEASLCYFMDEDQGEEEEEQEEQ